MSVQRNQLNSTGCRICNGVGTDRSIESGHYLYHRCSRCGSASLCPLPNPFAAAQFYDEGYFSGTTEGGYFDYSADEVLHRKNAGIRLARIMESVGNQGGQILDIGCAAGYFLSEAMSQGWKAFGMDVSPWAEKKVKMLPNVEFARNLESYRNSRSGEFEAVAMAQVLEHTVHPDILVEEAFALLRPGGTLFVETWNLESTAARIFGSRWQQISPPSVVHLFSQRGLIAMLKRFGFEKVIVRRGVKFVSADLVLHIIEQKYPWLTGVSLKNRLISLLRHTAIPYFLGDLIHVTASKPSP